MSRVSIDKQAVAEFFRFCDENEVRSEERRGGK